MSVPSTAKSQNPDSDEIWSAHETAESTTMHEQDESKPLQHSSQLPPSDDTPWKPSAQVKLVVLSLCIVVFIISLDMTIFTVTLPNVTSAINATPAENVWIVSSYLLANAVCQPVIAALADVFGRQALYFSGVLAFTIGSIVCSVTPNVAGLLAGRTVQGLGGGCILCLNLIILADIIPLRYRGTYTGYLQLIFGLGLTIAPLIGAELVKVSWRWLFYINLPFCAIGLLVVPFTIRYKLTKTTFYTKLSMIDWIGSTLCVLSSALLLTGLAWGGINFGWSAAGTLVPIFLGVLGLIATGLYERYLAKYPFLRLSLFRSWSAIAAYCCTFMQSTILLTMLYYLGLYLLACKGYSPVTAATASLALNLTIVPISGVTGILITRFGHYRIFITAGWILQTTSLGLLCLLEVDTRPVAWIWIFLLAGASQGVLLISHGIAVQAASDAKDAAYASNMYSFFRSFGLCVGVVIGGAIVQNTFKHRLTHLHIDIPSNANAEALAPLIASMPKGSLERQILQQSYAWALRRLWAIMCGLSGVSLLTSAAIGAHSLDHALQTNHILREAPPEEPWELNSRS